MESAALITNDAVLFGVLMVLLGLVFWTSSIKTGPIAGFYRIFPPLLLCYFLPSLLTTFGIADPDASQLYYVASRYLLPAALVLLVVSADLPATLRLGPKALIMFFTGTLGVVVGGPLALLLASAINPDLLGGSGPEEVWRGMATVAGSWIGGAANQTAIREIFDVGPEVFSVWVAVDVLVANVWLAILLFLAARRKQMDKALRADVSAIDDLQARAEAYEAQHARIPETRDLIIIGAVAFGAVAIAHFFSGLIAPGFSDMAASIRAEALETGRSPQGFGLIVAESLASGFFWLVAIATAIGVALSFTPARKLQAVGAMKTGSVFIYILVATVGLHMDITAIGEYWQFFLIGLLWIAIHAALMLGVAFLIRAPIFFVAVGSQANIGGAASAPVVASAFSPSLAPVGALLAVVGYIVGTYAAWFCGLVMASIAAGG
ncbi:MAG: hypothetical protein CMF74_09895 [Maricaulis sp.]|nr:hypothetical protein [Maricaulis sp.]